MLRRTQGGVSLCPGLSHFAPLGRRNEKTPIARGLSPVSSYFLRRFVGGCGVDVPFVPFLSPLKNSGTVPEFLAGQPQNTLWLFP